MVIGETRPKTWLERELSPLQSPDWKLLFTLLG